MPFTDMTVKALDVPPKGARTYYDDTLKGFGVRVSQGGTRTFVLMVGKERKRTLIGQYPHVTLGKARQIAKDLLAERQLSRHQPIQPPQPPKTSLAEGLSLYTTQHLAKLAPGTVQEQTRLFKRYLEPLNPRALADVTTQDITKITDAAAPSEAEHFHRVAKTFFRWCTGRRLIERSPIEGLTPPQRGKPRERALTDEELAIVLAKAIADASTIGRIVRLLIITGQRRGEIAGLRRAYINTKAETITWPGTQVKNGRTHTLPYTDMTKAVVAELDRNGDLLFPAKGLDDQPFNGFSKLGTAFIRSCPIAPWTLHDLRRTFASGMQRLGVRIEVTEKLLNHVSGTFSGITGVYQRHSYAAEMRAAALLWEAHLQSLLSK